MISRECYIKHVRYFYESDLIKLITGIRRSGKSVVLEQIKAELAAQGKPVIHLNFEDRAVSSKIADDIALVRYIENQTSSEPDKKWYIFLDEIQTVKNWNFACKTLRLKNLSVFITGSNSKLLSKEFTKELSGRYAAFTIRPFVYKEICEYARELEREVSISDYLVYGGFPKRLEFFETDAMLRYLNDLDETIVVNDIINRYKIRKESIFKKLTDFVLVSNARIFSSHSLHNYLKAQKIECSVNTVMKYLDYLEEAYVIKKIPQYSVIEKKHLDFYMKLYNEDVIFNSLRQSGRRFDLTHNLENIVYNELVFMGYELNVYNVNGREIDFLAMKDGKEFLVQVAYSVAEDAAYEREFAPFAAVDNLRKKILITNDDIDFSSSTVQHIKLSNFLMMEDLG
ncbi:MAG: ATP-binding protein [Treponema sp.]